MLVTERHIQYLEWVEQGRIVLKNSKYSRADWASGHIEVDQLVAIHSELMGLTRIVSHENTTSTVVALTHRGFAVINDEREAWG